MYHASALDYLAEHTLSDLGTHGTIRKSIDYTLAIPSGTRINFL